MRFFALTEFGGESSVSSSQSITCVQTELTDFFAKLTEFAQKLSEFSLSKQYSRNSIPPVSAKVPFLLGPCPYPQNLLEKVAFNLLEAILILEAIRQ